MHAHDIDTSGDPEGCRGQRALDALLRRQPEDRADGRLAARPQQDGPAQIAQCRETAQQANVVRGRLAEADTRVHDEPLTWAARRLRALQGRVQVGQHLADDVDVVALGSPVHDDVGCAVGRGHPRQRCACRDRRDVVEDVRPGLQRRLRHRRLARVDAERYVREPRPDGAHDVDDASHLVSLAHEAVAGTRGFAAHVEEVGALVDHAHGLGHGNLDERSRRAKQAIAAERVGGRVDDAHQVGTRAEAQVESPNTQCGRPVASLRHRRRPGRGAAAGGRRGTGSR